MQHVLRFVTMIAGVRALVAGSAVLSVSLCELLQAYPFDCPQCDPEIVRPLAPPVLRSSRVVQSENSIAQITNVRVSEQKQSKSMPIQLFP